MRTPLQNRCDPFGALHAVPDRGTLMGNRGGRFHRADRTLGTTQFKSRRWICCLCEFNNRQRAVFGDSYTEMFFLDEVTALAAGHRPCYECRRADAHDFASRLPARNGRPPMADAIDSILHRERMAIRRGDFPVEAMQSLPDGAMFQSGGRAWAVRAGKRLAWSFAGYEQAAVLTNEQVAVLTPATCLQALRNGFLPRWHASAARQA